MDSPDAAGTPAPVAKRPFSALAIVRDWCDALVITILLALFARTFLVELYKIPSGSMCPTLVGGQVIETDYNGDGRTDLLAKSGGAAFLFLNDGARLAPSGRVTISPEQWERYRDAGLIVERDDRILVNKFAFWWRAPRRGEIVVFKAPDGVGSPDKPIYIKRCVGEPGERLTLDSDGRLEADGKRVDEPAFFRAQHYAPPPDGTTMDVPAGRIYVFGDNTLNSSDSRMWGGRAAQKLARETLFPVFSAGQDEIPELRLKGCAL